MAAPSSNNFAIFKWVSFSTAVKHHALQQWRIDPFDLNEACGTLKHSYSPMVSSRITTYSTAFWWRRRISVTTSLISCYVYFCGTVRCYWGCSSVTYLFDFELSFKYFWGSVLQIYSVVSRVFMMVTVVPCFVAIFSMLLESIVTGLIMFFLCMVDC